MISFYERAIGLERRCGFRCWSQWPGLKMISCILAASESHLAAPSPMPLLHHPPVAQRCAPDERGRRWWVGVRRRYVASSCLALHPQFLVVVCWKSLLPREGRRVALWLGFLGGHRRLWSRSQTIHKVLPEAEKTAEYEASAARTAHAGYCISVHCGLAISMHRSCTLRFRL